MRHSKLVWRGGSGLALALAISGLAHVLVLTATHDWITVPELQVDTARYQARLVEPQAPVTAPVVTPTSQPVRSAPRARPPIKVAALQPEPVVIITKPVPAPVVVSEAQVPEPPPAIASTLPPAEPERVAAVTPSTAPPPPSPKNILPALVSIEYQLNSSLVDGRADYNWRQTDSGYAIDSSVEANGLFATMFVGRIEQTSQGDITAGGLRPARFSLKRGEATPEVAEFNWAAKTIRQQRARGDNVQALEGKAQDLLSFIFQFAYEFPAPGRKSVAFPITNARKIDRYEFRVIGTETLNLPIGQLETLHLVRQTSDPTDAYEVWLAPRHHYLPVKLRFMLGGRVKVEQVAVQLTTSP